MTPKLKKTIPPFYQQVYEATSLVPRGRVSTYAAVARFLGKPKAVRAVGNALHVNPFAPKVPCHRIVKSDGRVGNFVDGTKRKVKILTQEGIRCSVGRVLDWPNKLFALK